MQQKIQLYPAERLKYRDPFAGSRKEEFHFGICKRHPATLFDDLLREWVPEAIEVGIFNIFPAAIRAGMNLLCGKWILDERESGFALLELGIGVEIETSQFPQPMVELAFDLRCSAS